MKNSTIERLVFEKRVRKKAVRQTKHVQTRPKARSVYWYPRCKDKSKVEIKSAQRKSKECKEEESKHKFYIGSATTRAYIQSSSNLLRFTFLVKILYKQRATKDVPSLMFTITTKKLPTSYTEFSDG